MLCLGKQRLDAKLRSKQGRKRRLFARPETEPFPLKRLLSEVLILYPTVLVSGELRAALGRQQAGRATRPAAGASAAQGVRGLRGEERELPGDSNLLGGQITSCSRSTPLDSNRSTRCRPFSLLLAGKVVCAEVEATHQAISKLP